VSGLEITRVDWDAGRAHSTADELTREALVRAGERLLDAASQRVPVRTGELAASAELAVDGDGDGVAIGYTAAHARYVHAHPEWQFASGRSGHWLDDALDAEADATGQLMADTIRSGWPG
jgi:hypothetical protein